MLALSMPAAAPAVVLAAGAACVAAALWMLLARSGRQALAVVALLAGTGLLALPWALGRPDAVEPAAVAPEPVAVPRVVLSSDGLRTVAAPPVEGRPPPLPGRAAARIDIEGTEVEPNDTLAAANLANSGIAILGTLTDGDLDFFAVDMPPRIRGEIVAGLLVLEGDAGLTIFDDAGQPLGSADTSEQISVRTTTLSRMIAAPRYYVLVRGAKAGGVATYQLTIAVRRR